MFLAYQIPIADARLFTQGTSRLYKPDWPYATAGTDFVRHFGPVRDRTLGPGDGFHDELVFAEADHALRFPNLERRRLGRGPAAFVPPYGRYRRMYCSSRRQGAAVVRLEIGLSDGNGKYPRLPVHLSGNDWAAIAAALFELPVKVVHPKTLPLQVSLWTCGKAIAAFYDESTQARSALRTPKDLVANGQPLVLFEYSSEECGALPARAQRIDSRMLSGVDLAYLWVQYRGRRVGIWLLRNDGAPPDVIRRVRVALLRLHAEHQVLKHVLALLARGVIVYHPGTPAADALDSYLNWATRLLDRVNYGGFSPGAIRDVLTVFDTLIDTSQRQLLAERLKDVRRQIRAKVVRHADRTGSSPGAGDVETVREVRVFVAYSHADSKYLSRDDRYSLLSFLEGLSADGFDFFHDRDILTGDVWDERIRTEIDRSDIALMLVSQAFLNSAYCTNVEARSFVEASQERGLVIYPLILSPCDWKRKGWLSRLQKQPPDDDTIETHYQSDGRRKQLYLTIMTELRQIAERGAQPPSPRAEVVEQ